MRKILVEKMEKAAMNFVAKSGSMTFCGEVKVPECLKMEAEKKMNQK